MPLAVSAAARRTAIAGAFLAGAALSAPAADATEFSGCALADGCIAVVIDHFSRVALEEPVKTVLIGNPAIAEVTMISDTQAIVSARSIGATNLMFLNDDGAAIGDYEILVREGRQRRVMLRRGPNSTSLFQCAPRCERTLTLLDSDEAHSSTAGKISRETGLNSAAVGAAEDE